jgi:hypothetical protein
VSDLIDEELKLDGIEKLSVPSKRPVKISQSSQPNIKK